MVLLRIIEGPGSGLAVELSGDLSIGRDPACGLQLGDVKASRRHVQINQRDGQWHLRDMGSANGTWLGSKKVSSIHLENGCEFRIGSTILRFEHEAGAADGQQAEADDWGDTITGLEGSQLLQRGNSSNGADPCSSNDYLVLLHQVVHRCQGAQHREELFDLLDDIAADALDGDRCAVFLPKGDDWLLWPPHERRLRARFGATPFARTLLAAARSRAGALLCTARGDLDPSLSMAQAGVRSAMVAPLRIGAEIHALLYVDRLDGPEPFSRTDLEFLEAVANQLAVRLHNMSEMSRLSAEVERLSAQRPREAVTLIGSDTHLGAARAFIERSAAASTPLLIIGESGTGKHSLAKAIHLASARNQAALQVLSCAGLDEAMCELSLFGRAGGGVEDARPGLLELADGGTIFIDEVGNLSPLLQRRLLTLLDQGHVQRLGEPTPRSVDVRVITSCSQDPEASGITPELAEHLEIMSLRLPPLRERPEDIEMLVEHFIVAAAERLDQPVRRLAQDARSLILAHPWPGNVRQLRSAIERAMVMAQGPLISAEDLPESLRESTAPADSNEAHHAPLIPLAEMERLHIMRMLEHCGGNKKAAAELLGIDRSTLYAKLRQYGLHG